MRVQIVRKLRAAAGSSVTLHQTHRHAGHADIVRELIDGSVGLRADNSNLPPGDQTWWQTYRDRLEAAAREVGP